MGSSQSVNNKSVMDVKTTITQISEQHCINVVRNSSAINVTIVSSKVGDINISRRIFINGASCNLKASLSNELINELEDVQVGEVIFEEGALGNVTPFQALASVLSGIGQNNEVTNENYQYVTNQVTQILNSTCQNKVLNDNAPINLIITDTKAKDINIQEDNGLSNTSCDIDNMVKSYIKNDVKNTQTATIKKETGTLGALEGLIMIIIIIVVVFVLMGGKGLGALAKKGSGSGGDNN